MNFRKAYRYWRAIHRRMKPRASHNRRKRLVNYMLSTETTQKTDADWCSRLEGQVRNEFAKVVSSATPDELFRAAASVLRPTLVNGLLETEDRFHAADAKAIYYLSMEFLLGRSLSNNLHNLGLYSEIEHAFASLG